MYPKQNLSQSYRVPYYPYCSFQKYKTAENKMQEQEELINTLKQELEKSKVSIFDEKSQQKKLETQIDQLKSELSDIQRTERVVRIDLEQATKRVGLLSPTLPMFYYILHLFKHCYRSSLKCWVLDILKNFKVLWWTACVTCICRVDRYLKFTRILVSCWLLH